MFNPSYNVKTTKLRLLISSILFRLINFCIVRTYFVPDEYYQGSEVAYYLFAGKGQLTWEWEHKIRSSIFVFALKQIYSTLRYLNLDSRTVIKATPGMVMTIIAIISDVTFYKFIQIYSKSTSLFIYFAYATNWFVIYCMPRFLANTFEMHLIIFILYYYAIALKHNHKHSDGYKILYTWLSSFLICFTLLYRPTFLSLLLLPLYQIYHSFYQHDKIRPIDLLTIYISAGIVALTLHVLCDYIFYGTLQITALKFFQYNLIYHMNQLFGVHPVWWYFVLGIPMTLGIHLLPFMLSLKSRPVNFLIFTSIPVIVLSLISHKEHRFLLPLQPVFSIACGSFYAKLWAGQITWLRRRFPQTWVIARNVMLTVVILAQINVALYFSVLHQRGPLDLIDFVWSQWKTNKFESQMNVLLVMPCFSTPGYASLHTANIRLEAFVCEPIFPENNLTIYSNHTIKTGITMRNDYERFLSNPNEVLNQYFDSQSKSAFTWNYVCYYSNINHIMVQYLSSVNLTLIYNDCKKLFHTHWPIDNMATHIQCLCHNNKLLF